MDKCRIKVQSVGYFGNVITDQGVKPDPEKVDAINRMQAPTCKTELVTTLGMVNYLCRFMPNLANVTAPMRELVKQDVEFIWQEPQKKSFAEMKALICKETTLAFYDPRKELTLQVDASLKGLGAALMQEGRPIAFASKSLSQSEQNYAQIEKEMYAITFGCERFHQYIYGRMVTVESDHKPLEAINRKPLALAPARLQRMILRIQKYDQLNIVFKAGKEIPVADTLSRNFIQSSKVSDSLKESMNAQIHLVMSSTGMSDRKMSEIRKETQNDELMCELMDTIRRGWPNERRDCPKALTAFWNIRDELAVMENMVFKADRIVIPKTLKTEMLFRIHIGHLGIEKCRQRARQSVYWPGMNNDIEELVSRCGICQERRDSNGKEPMIPTPIPSRPWQIVGSDLFQWEGESYLAIVDYYSRYIEIERLRSTTSAAVIKKTKGIFARHGIPSRVMSDNGPQYASQEFSKFAEKWDFRHVTSSPTHAQSNGLSEKAVQIAKRILDKAKASHGDPYIAMMEYRNTPIDNFATPAQLLMSRNIRTFMPVTDRQLTPKTVNKANFAEVRERAKSEQKKSYDRKALKLPLKPLCVGDQVRIQQSAGWKPAEVVELCDSPRSYVVKTEEGATLRRNRKHLLSSAQPRPEQLTPTDADGLNTPTTETVAENNDTSGNASPQYVSRSGRVVKPRDVLDL